MSSRDAAALSFVERHNLWSDEQQRRAREIEKQIETLDLVRFAFADQHGVLRGKTVVASQAAKLMRNAAVPKLAGIVAYKRHQLDVARAKFDESWKLGRDDCETSF